MSKTTILIVEDEAIVAADLAAKLRQLGYEVAGVAASGEAAIGQASRLRPDLVLMDIMLEGPMDGIEAAGTISREFDVPVIYLTAHSDAATLTRAKITQPFGYILKPFDERELATNIEMALYKHESDRKLREQGEALRKSRDDLELRVRERTAELREAYEKLLEETEERKRLEDQLRQAHKMEAVGTLAGGIAHDFNNMLAAILGNAELALDDVDTENPARRNLDQILKATHRARDLVSEILTFSRKSGKEQKPLRLSPLVEETFKLLRASLPATIRMDLRVAGTDDVMVANPSQIQQVIMNLATNAAQAMPGGGQLEIALFDARFDSGHAVPDPDMRPGDYIELVVRDTGCGIDEAIQRRIFEPFFTTKAAGSGTGLGLSVVYGIIKSCQGAIILTSEVSKGSTFKILLPKAQGGVEAVEGSRATLPRGTEKVIFVDDEETLRDLGESILSRLGYKVTTAEDPGHALRLFRDDPKGYDLIITDYTMPGMTGLTLSKEILRIKPETPIILCTGYSEGIDEEKARDVGVKEFVMKPLTKQELAEAVRRALDPCEAGEGEKAKR